MSVRDSNEIPPDDDPREESPAGDVAREDWTRYGLSHREQELQRDALGRPLEPAEGIRRVKDGLLPPRRETAKGNSKPPRAPRGSKFTANVAAVSVVGVVGVIVLIFAVVSAGMMPVPSPTPARTPVALLSSASPGPSASATIVPGRVGILINLPMALAITDRDQPPDDGTFVYLVGATGGVALDPGSGKVRTVYGGAAFAKGVRRSVVDGGLWVSSWPTATASCGPSCWPAAATYRIDLVTGSVTNTLAATYLMGAASDGVWVASGGKLQQLDPDSGAVLSTTPWFGPGEPRVGCGSLWSFAPATGGAKLTMIDPASGTVIGQSTLDPGVTYGPTFVEGQCWMMSGSGGASKDSTILTWLNPDGTTQVVGKFQASIVTLDHEFWRYTPDGTIQRFDAALGYGYGVSYSLAAHPRGDDPSALFAASGTLWMIDGLGLVGFQIPTGTSRVNG